MATLTVKGHVYTIKQDKTGDYIVVKSGHWLVHIAAAAKGEPYNIKDYNQLHNINQTAKTMGKDPDKLAAGQKVYLKLSDEASSSSSSKTAVTDKAKIIQFGEQNNNAGTLFATWDWDGKNTDKYTVEWDYATGDGVWFVGEHTDVKVKQDTYSIPSNATKVRFRVKAVAKGTTNSKTNKTTYPWPAKWSERKTWYEAKSKAITELEGPTPSAELDPDNKYQIIATATVDDNLLDKGATHVEFIIRQEGSTKKIATGKAKIDTIDKSASYVFKVDTGKTYEVYCRAYNSSLKVYSEYSKTSGTVLTLPAVPSGLKIVKAELISGIDGEQYKITIKWNEVATASSYDIEYTTQKALFDVVNGVESYTHEDALTPNECALSLPVKGAEVFFRVRAKNSSGDSAGWSSIKSVVIGKEPSPPTIWLSHTTATAGDNVTLYWTHNSEDGSRQTRALIAYREGGSSELKEISLDYTPDYSKDEETYYYTFQNVKAGQMTFRIKTMGARNDWSNYSIMKRLDVSAPPTLTLSMEDSEGDDLDTLTAFPFYIKTTAGPSPQKPIGYHISIISNETYDTIDQLGNAQTIASGQEIYSKYFDTNQNPLNVKFSAENVDLENGIEYTVTCTVTMDSGKDASASHVFVVDWADTLYVPNAEVTFDNDTLTAFIRPYCEKVIIKFHEVSKKSGTKYIDTEVPIGAVYGDEVRNAVTDTGHQVYFGTTADGDEVYYCMVEEPSKVKNAKLSVYRREFDGTFTELATGLSSSKSTTITDPHPALDYARYRIVATDNETGAVSYYDPPGFPVDCPAIIIQWDEQWSEFDTEEDAELEQPPWTGSLLKLPYNVDVSENVSPDVETIEYIGRSNPVSYYGTQVGQTASWSVEIDKNDVDTIYALRRLARWMGDVYVREPSGVGYWANITVSFSQKHCALTVPVSLSIIRVEGGV